MSKRAVIYARFSTENQKDASIDDQFRVCQRVVDSNGFTLVARFEDRGISGGTDQRPGYQAMLTMAQAGGFDVIVAEDISRLWRSKVEYSARSAQLEDLGIHLITAAGDDTRREGWGLIFDIKAAMAAQYRKDISYRTRRGLEGKALRGESTGGRCFGYTSPKDGPVAVYEPQAAAVRFLFETAAEGATAKELARRINAQGVPSPRGGSWGESTVKAILRNRRYLGEVIWGAAEVKSSARDSANKTRVRRAHPLSVRTNESLRIVPQELFDKVQKIRAKALAKRDWLCENFSTVNQPARN